MRFLLFTLYAPLGSLGDIAVGERRMGWARPGRSAIFGLVAAAQGIDRKNDPAHLALETGLFYAVKTDAPGQPFIDYHTAQMPKAKRDRVFATRREELAADDLNTVLSSREWRSDAFFTIALWLRPNSQLDLSDIKAALHRPFFTLYLGRKSAPLGLPLNAQIVEADNIITAFAARMQTVEEEAVLKQVDAASHPEIAFDNDAEGAPTAWRVERRRDAIVSRTRWQFGDRLEGIASPDRSKP